MSLEAVAFLTKQHLRLLVSRTCCNARGRKSGHGIWALDRNFSSGNVLNEKKVPECSSCFVLSNWRICL